MLNWDKTFGDFECIFHVRKTHERLRDQRVDGDGLIVSHKNSCVDILTVSTSECALTGTRIIAEVIS